MTVRDVGLVVVTYQRPDRVTALTDAIASRTRSPYRLVIADDGTGPELIEQLRARGHLTVTGANRGVAWNKNRGLFAAAGLGCDPILVLEDDVLPVRDGWDADWIEGTARWDHLAFMHPKVSEQSLRGTGTPGDPYLNPKTTAQCLSVSLRSLRQVGFMDSRFRGWGHEHAEWTSRMRRLGLGYQDVTGEDGTTIRCNLYLEGGLDARDAPSFRNKAEVEANLRTYERIRGEPVFRPPWYGEDERADFLREQHESGLGESAIERALSLIRHGSGPAAPR